MFSESAPTLRRNYTSESTRRFPTRNSNWGGRFYVKDEEALVAKLDHLEVATSNGPEIGQRRTTVYGDAGIEGDMYDEVSAISPVARTGRYWNTFREELCPLAESGDPCFPEFNIDGGFTQNLARQFVVFLNTAKAQGHKLVVIRINSRGGDVGALNIMLSHIQVAKNEGVIIATSCDGEAMSCGAILLGMGTYGYRSASLTAKILFHRVSAGCQGNVEEMKTEFAEINYTNSELFLQVARNVGLEDENFFLNMVMNAKGNLNIHTPNAVDLMIVDRIGLPSIVKRVDISYALEYSGPEYSQEEIREMIEQRKNDVLQVYDNQMRDQPTPTLRRNAKKETAASPNVKKDVKREGLSAKNAISRVGPFI